MENDKIKKLVDSFVGTITESIELITDSTLVYRIKGISSYIRSVQTGLYNLWIWKNTIYNDRWWDYSFFMRILKFKLVQMEKNWDQCHYVGSEYDKKDLGSLIKILENLEDDELEQNKREKLFDELYTRLFKVTSTHRINKDYDKGELYDHSIGIERLWD